MSQDAGTTYGDCYDDDEKEEEEEEEDVEEDEDEDEDEDEEYSVCGSVRDLALVVHVVSMTVIHFLGMDPEEDMHPDGTIKPAHFHNGPINGIEVMLVCWLPDRYHSKRLQPTGDIELKGLYLEEPKLPRGARRGQ